MLLVLMSLPAFAWPTDAEWTPVQQGASPMTDASEDNVTGDGHVDLVGSATLPLFYWSSDGTDMFLRMRLDEDPVSLTGFLRDSGWGVAFDLDADQIFDWVLSVDESIGILELRENSSGSSGSRGDTSANVIEISGAAFVTGEVRVVTAASGSIFTGDADYFLDIEVPWSELSSGLGVDDTYGFEMALFTGENGVEDFDADVSGTGTRSDLTGAWSDTVGFDQDGDGLTDAEEAIFGSSPTDRDSDDDGLDDLREFILSLDPLNCDSDGDGLTDGLERGVETAGADTDTSAGCFFVDSDPTSKTNANKADTDSGGVFDGDEDWNSDGDVGEWEIDPNNTADDVDTDNDGIWDVLEEKCDKDGGEVDDADSDGDGISDADEGLTDTDGDGVPNFCDEDSDGDGIDDANEGDGDVDGDDIPNYLDPDADGDGKLDEDEGDGDDDGDGTPNWEDPDDEDGPDGDRDDDGLSNADEDECGSNPDDADTDGDGINDLDEGPCDEDTDCDSIPNWNDAVFDEGLCPDDSGTDDTAVFPGGTFTDGNFTGGSCNFLPTNPGLLAGLIGLAALARRRRRAGLLSLGLLIPGTAVAQDGAQSLDAQRYRPAQDGQRFFVVNDTQVGPALTSGGGVVFNYAQDPFIYRYSDGRDSVKLLESVGTANALAWLNLPRARIGLDLPLHVLSTGYRVDGFRLVGDARIMAVGELIQRGDSGLGLGVSAWLDLPTGNEETWLGEASTTGGGALGASYATGQLLAAANVGASTGTGSQFLDDLDWGNHLTWNVGLSYLIVPRIDVSAEFSGEHLLGQDAPGASPAEFTAGMRYHPQALPLIFSLGGGSGITSGIGAPDFRIIGGLVWAPAHDRTAGPVGGDRDRDTIADEVDMCPDQAEDFNGVDDSDGCPDGNLTPTRIRVMDGQGNLIADAVVSLNSGPETGSYTLGSGELMRSLPPGEYTVKTKAKNYSQAQSMLQVPEGRTHALDVRLKKVLAPGTVIVSAKTSDGLPVPVNVRVLGETPRRVPATSDGVTQLKLPPGTYSLVLSADGYRNVEKTVTLDEAGTATVEVVMEGGRV
ncbi:MAG: hypothetical protein ACI9VR_002436, partial [Cognaticolwellia sp.]